MKFDKLSLQYWNSDDGRFRIGQPALRRISRKEFKLTAPYRAVWRAKNGTTSTLVAPEGYRCDLSTIPRIFHSIVPKSGLHDGPSVIHDLCYERLWSTRWDADKLFLVGMKHAGVNWLRRNVMFLAVRAGGWILWNKRVRLEARSSSAWR